MKISKKTHYGIQMLTYLAQHPGEHVSLATLARELDLPLAFLKHIASDLKRHRILASQGGMQGGYRLRRAPEDLSLATILKSLGEPIDLTPCRNPSCSHRDCLTGPFWSAVSSRIEQAFAQSNLALVLKTK